MLAPSDTMSIGKLLFKSPDMLAMTESGFVPEPVYTISLSYSSSVLKALNFSVRELPSVEVKVWIMFSYSL